jgi:hypothetical protein
MDSVGEILTEMGYSLRDYGKEYRTTPLYRESDNPTVLSIKKETGRWVDFKHSLSGSFEELVKLTLNLKSLEEAENWLKTKNHYSTKTASRPKLKTRRSFNKSTLESLVKDHSYWENRGIGADTMELFSGGIMPEGRMKNRYVFPIFNSEETLIGFTGRYLYANEKVPKWKHLGDKSQWIYPLQINHDIIKEQKEIILIESVGDMLSLWEAGIKNSMVIFGLDVSVPQLNALIRRDPNKIIISLNNDEQNNSAGNLASEKLERKLLKYFDRNQVAIHLPTANDFGEMSPKQIKEWELKLM